MGVAGRCRAPVAQEERPRAVDDRRGPIRVGVPQLPPGTIRRRRLTERLARRVPLTVLRAPTGFGKTVAVAQWLADPSGPAGPATWLRAGPALGTVAFWSEFSSLLTEAGLEAPPVDGPRHREIETALRRNGAPITIVVDGFDEVPDPAVERQLIDLARFCPQVHLVVCLRSSQHFPASIRVGIATTLIDSTELAFTAEEIADLTPAPTGPSRGDWAAWIRRSTGGWPELVRSVLLALHDDPHQAINAATLDVAREFVVERVLSAFRHDEWVQFMLTTSLPEALTERIAEHISGDPLAGRRLKRLESAGMLSSSLHHGARVYRWPQPARRALQEEFRRREPRRAVALHVRLANQYLRGEDPRSALRHALLAGDTALLVRLVAESWGRFIHDDPAALDTALAAVPVELILASPDAAAARDVRMHMRGDVVDDAVLALPDPLPSAPERLTRLARSGSAKATLCTASSMMIAMRVRGLAGRALDYADRVGTISAVAGASHWTDVEPSLPSTQLQIGVTRLLFDRLPDAEKNLRQAHHASADETRGYVRRDSAGKLALLHALRGDTAQAESWLDQHRKAPATTGGLTPDIEHSGHLAEALVSIDRLDSDGLARVLPLIEHNDAVGRNWGPFASYLRARQALVWGDRQGALRQLEEESRQFTRWLSPDSTIAPFLAAIEVDLLLSLGRGSRARGQLNRSEAQPALLAPAARLALLCGDNDQARRLAGRRHRSQGPNAWAELLLVGAIARFRQGELSAAADGLTQALRIAEGGRTLTPFILTPADELRAAAALAPEVSAMLESEPLRAVGAPFPTKVTLIELTDRERTVLSELANGRTLQEIATSLFVSYNTVKTQVRSLYAKLGANSRSSAIAAAAEHGLLTGAAPGGGKHRGGQRRVNPVQSAAARRDHPHHPAALGLVDVAAPSF